MAALTHPCWQTITDPMRHILTMLGGQNFIQRFYLAGGTALALQIGHRKSIDLDFFSEYDEVTGKTRQEIIQACRQNIQTTEILENVDGNLLLILEGVHLGFFSYGYPLLRPTKKVLGCRLADLADIGLMKMDELISRGSRKDFYDLYWIVKEISAEKLLLLGEEMYPGMRDFPLMAVEHMILFDNAEGDDPPQLLKFIGWEEVKAFFTAQARILGNDWFLEEN